MATGNRPQEKLDWQLQMDQTDKGYLILEIQYDRPIEDTDELAEIWADTSVRFEGVERVTAHAFNAEGKNLAHTDARKERQSV